MVSYFSQFYSLNKSESLNTKYAFALNIDDNANAAAANDDGADTSLREIT